MATDISIVNEALLMVGAEQITSFSDAVREAEVASAIYQTTKESIISRSPWTFTLGQAQLAKLVSTPLFEFDNAFQLPVSRRLLRLIRKNSPRNDYRLFEDKLYTDDDDVEIIYQFDPGEANYPMYFVRALTYELAKIFALALMQDETQAGAFDTLATKELRIAKSTDSQGQPSLSIDPSEFALTAVR